MNVIFGTRLQFHYSVPCYIGIERISDDQRGSTTLTQLWTLLSSPRPLFSFPSRSVWTSSSSFDSMFSRHYALGRPHHPLVSGFSFSVSSRLDLTAPANLLKEQRWYKKDRSPLSVPVATKGEDLRC